MEITVDPIVFNVDFAREQFPFFDLEQSKEWAFLQNAGGTFPCRAVVDRLTHFYRENKVQPYGADALSSAAGEQMDQGRNVISELLGVPAETLTLGPSTTQNFNTLSIACSTFLGKDDEILISEQEHESNIGGWERMVLLTGASLRFWPVDVNTGELNTAKLERCLNKRTKIICVTHSSNILGTINPIHEIIRLGHDVGAKVIVDGVSYAPHSWPDLSSIAADAYLFSTYKTYATHLGVMYVAPDFLEQLTAQCHFFNAGRPWSRLDSAGPDHAAIAALSGLGEFFETLHTYHFGPSNATLHQKATAISKLMKQHEQTICKLLLEAVDPLSVRIIGKSSMEGREANISFVASNHSSSALAKLLSEKGVATGNGHFYAFRLLEKLGINTNDGVVRLSLVHYNTEDDIVRLIDALNATLRL